MDWVSLPRSRHGRPTFSLFGPRVYSGRKFDWDPLDVVVPSINDNTTCVGSIVPTVSLSGFDFHAGDVFLRSLYTV